MYKYGFIDAQYLIRRNSSKLYSERPDVLITWRKIAESFLSSINVLRREVEFEIPILLWDLGPYRKVDLIPNYKGDRGHIYQSDIDEKIAEYDANPSPELFEEITQMKNDRRQEDEFDKAKEFLINILQNNCIQSLIVKGIEADDWACMIGLLDPSYTIKSVFITIDSDWMYYPTPNIDLYRLTKERQLLTYDDVCEQWGMQDWFDYIGQKCHLLHFKICNDIYYGNHDNVHGCEHKCKKVNSMRIVKFEELFLDISKKDISEYRPKIKRRIRKYYKALDSRKYFPEFEQLLKDTLAFRQNQDGVSRVRNILSQEFICVNSKSFQF